MKSAPKAVKPFRLGAFLIDPSSDQISLEGEHLKVEPKVMEVLLYLIENRNRVVSVDDILATVWQGVVVTPQTAQRCISVLRKLFGKANDEREYIKTFIKKGYQIGVEPDLPAVMTSVSKKRAGLWVASASLLSLIVILSLLWLNSSPREKVIYPNETMLSTYALHPTLQVLAYIQREPLSTEGSVWVGDLQEARQVASLGNILSETQINWSPDGRTLVVMVNKTIKLYALSPDLSEVLDERVVLSEENYRYRHVNFLDENNLLITRIPRTKGVYDLYQLNLQSGELSAVLRDSGVRKIAPHKQLLAYTQRNASVWSVKATNLHNNQTLFTHPFKLPITDLEWLLDGSGLIVQLDQTDLYHIPVNGKPVKLESSQARERQEIELGHNQKLYFIKQETVSKLFLGQASECCAEPLMEGQFAQSSAVWHPKGNAFVYVSTESGHPEVWLHNGESRSQLTDFKQQQAIGQLNWSPDGRWLLFKVNDDIYAYSLVLDKGNTLLKNEFFGAPLGVTQDNESFYYLDTNGYRDRVWRVSFDDFSKQEVLEFADETQVVSYGGHIFYLGKGKSDLYLYDGHQSRLLDGAFADDAILHSANENELFYWLNQPGKMKTIWSLDLATGQKRIVVERLSYTGDVLSISSEHRVLYEQNIETTRQLHQVGLKQVLQSH